MAVRYDENCFEQQVQEILTMKKQQNQSSGFQVLKTFIAHFSEDGDHTHTHTDTQNDETGAREKHILSANGCDIIKCEVVTSLASGQVGAGFLCGGVMMSSPVL